MIMQNDYLLVEFDLSHNKQITFPDGTTLIRPDTWQTVNPEDGSTQWAENLDRRDVNPQIATVIIGNDKSFLKPGDRVFTHFLCVENGTPITYNGKEYLAITTNQVYFVINGKEDYRMMPKIHLGEQVYTDARTPSGIYVTPTGEKKEVLKVKIDYVPEEGASCRAGDTVMSVDDYQYQLKLDGKLYVMLRDWEITGHVPKELELQKNISRPTLSY